MPGWGYHVIWIGALVLGAVFSQLLSVHLSRRNAIRSTSDGARIRARITRLARPTVLLVPATSPGLSKLGGEPDLPSEVEWPRIRGQTYRFLAQIDLIELHACEALAWLPSSGSLFFFVDDEGYGYDGQVAVCYAPDALERIDRAPMARAYGERQVAFEAYASTPSLEWLGEDLTEITSAELDKFAGNQEASFGDELQHRIGGYPSEIQGGRMGVECELRRRGLPDDSEITEAIERAARSWRLLLQIDTDEGLSMNWGDGGRLYVFVREVDAKAGRFNATITLSQTY